jgi:ribosomal protein S18 acetylase RimI-like enzyme
MEIKPCIPGDVDEILSLYEFARDLQRHRKMVVWPFFEKAFLEKEIQEQRQWKLIVDNKLASNWAVTFEDKEIWEEKDSNDAIYIHRIATHPDFRGQRFINNLVQWAKQYALQKGRKFVRLDTLGNNTKLIQHYTSAGFQFLGMFKLTDTSTLPLHYQNEPNCCLFELALIENG